jgi:hypothetical protein
MTITRAEQVMLSCVAVLTGGVTVPYVADALGLGVLPLVSAAAAITIGAGAAAGLRRQTTRGRKEVVALTLIVGAAAAYFCWLAWPSLLPPGGSRDLTHHLVLIDYIERHATLVHEPDANGLLGEMADYTPGVHLLAVLAGAILRSSGFAAVYPLIALSVALKAGVFFLIMMRLLAHHPQRLAIALGGVGVMLHASPYSVHSFTRDSFLAQVVSELFALVMWWALVVWWQHPARVTMIVFAAAGTAVFLTWPMWIGPPVLACAIAVAGRRDMAWSARARHLMVAIAPIAVVAAFHTAGRTAAVSIVGTGGAVTQPSPLLFGWWLPALAIVGLIVAAADRRYRMLLIFAAAIALQAGALLVVARRRGADTPYMAIKMTYLAIYPVIAAIAVGVSIAVKTRVVAWAMVVVVVATGIPAVTTTTSSTPVVSHDLWRAGRWARENLRPACVDYLVANPDTAYWLHLAVMGNRRASERSVDDTFATHLAFERWLTGTGPPYAIANLAVVPADLLENARVVHRDASAAVIQRPPSTQVAADNACVVSWALP